MYAHKDIIEGGKDHKDIKSLFRIGKTLKIGEDTFEDLDEVSHASFCNIYLVIALFSVVIDRVTNKNSCAVFEVHI